MEIFKTLLIGIRKRCYGGESVNGDKEFRWAKQALDPLDCVHLGGKPLAIEAASNFRFLRSNGVTIRKTVDMLIGTWCIEHNVELYTTIKIRPNGYSAAFAGVWLDDVV